MVQKRNRKNTTDVNQTFYRKDGKQGMNVFAEFLFNTDCRMSDRIKTGRLPLKKRPSVSIMRHQF